MTDEFVRRFNPSTAQWIATATKLAIMRTSAMLAQMHPAFMTSGKAGGLKDSEPLKAVEVLAA